MTQLVIAQEGAAYNFASAQGGKQIKVLPGDVGKGNIYFYNIDGNSITHITLAVTNAPDNWKVDIQPPQDKVEVEIGGDKVTVEENLNVEPSDLLPEEPEDVPEGMVSIVIPGRGYALARPADIIVRVPEREKVGTKGDILISAQAEWLGQGGAATIKQTRDFEFSVEVVSEVDSTETIMSPGFSIMRWLPAIVAGLFVILGAVLIPRLVARRKKGQKSV